MSRSRAHEDLSSNCWADEQTVHEAREEERGRAPFRMGRTPADEERVLPAKRSIPAEVSRASGNQPLRPQLSRTTSAMAAESSRREQQGIRGLWQTMWRNSDGASSQATSSSNFQFIPACCISAALVPPLLFKLKCLPSCTDSNATGAEHPILVGFLSNSEGGRSSCCLRCVLV
jgi:hypothetical protein